MQMLQSLQEEKGQMTMLSGVQTYLIKCERSNTIVILLHQQAQILRSSSFFLAVWVTLTSHGVTIVRV